MKTRFTSNEIAHVWAHKSAPYGKSPGAMSFQGDSFYSYGTVIARHIEHKGKQAIILNDRSFGPTTSKHSGKVRSAIHGLDVPRFHFSEGYNARLAVSGKELFEYALNESAEALKLASRARSQKSWHESKAAGWLASAQQINEFFGLRRKVDEKTIERLKESAQRAEREAAKKRRVAEAKARVEQTKAFEAWKRNERLPDDEPSVFNPSIFPVAFRIEGEELVSSRGARVPIEAARVALKFALKHRATGWHRNGSTCEVGYYQLDAINDQGIVAGCHRITWEEVERVAAMLA